MPVLPEATTLGLEAMRWADRGFSVVPLWSVGDNGRCRCGDRACERQGKHPMSKLVPHGLTQATRDHRWIERWWRSEPHNIGIRLDRWLAVDGDCRVPKLRDTLDQWGREDEHLAHTLWQFTGRYGGDRGFHAIYELPGAVEFKAHPWPGVDIKYGSGAYLVAAPSRHFSGVSYELIDQPIAQAPAWLIEGAMKRASPENNSNGGDGVGLAGLLAHPPVGENSGRNVWLSQVAGHFAARFPKDDFWQLMSQTNASLSAPLDPDEVRKVAASIWEREQAKRQQPEEDPDQFQFEQEVRQHQFRLRVQREARRREEADAAATASPELQVVAAADLLAMPGADEPLAYTVDQVFPDGHNISLPGATTLGKTTLLLNLARALVDGESFLGQFPTHLPAGRVAFWNYEVTERQFLVWLREIGFQHPERVSPLTLRGKHVDLMTGSGQDFAVRWLEMNEVRVWMLDPWAEILANSGLSENDNAEARRLGNAINLVKEQGGVSGAVITCHTGRADKERSRGAQALDDWSDTLWLMAKDPEGERYFGTLGGRDVKKAEWQLGFDEPTRTLRVAGGGRRDPGGEALETKILQAVASQPGATRRALRNVEGSSEKIDQALARLVADGFVRVEADSGSSHAKRHYLSARGRTRVPGAQGAQGDLL
jgi:hypothetical protein